MYLVHNRMQRAFIIPATADDAHKSVTVNPGEHAVVLAEHWDTVRKGNDVIDALLTGRHLVVSSAASVNPASALDDPLANPTPPQPEQLDPLTDTKGREVVAETKAQEVVEVGGDPVEAKPVRRK